MIRWIGARDESVPRREPSRLGVLDDIIRRIVAVANLLVVSVVLSRSFMQAVSALQGAARAVDVLIVTPQEVIATAMLIVG